MYEQVEKKELTETQKQVYYRKRYGYTVTLENNNYKLVSETKKNHQTDIEKKYTTLIDSSGNVSWTMESSRKSETNKYLEEQRYFYSSQTGITAIRDYNSTNSFFWVDKQGNELNRFELKDNQTAYVITTLKDGEIWMIQTKFHLREWEYDKESQEGSRERLHEYPNLSSLIFCDRNGNVLNKIDMKYAQIHNEKTISKSEDYIMYTCYKNIQKPNQIWPQHHSYIIKYDGSILKEYEDDGVWLINGSFSDNEDIYVTRGGTDFILDLPTGDIIASYETHGRSAVADKEIGIMAVLDFGTLRIINYKSNILLFYKNFDVYPKPGYVEITGDGKEVIVVTKEYLYTFRMKK